MSSNFFGISKVKFTPEGGLAVRVLNETGGPSIKGYIVEPGPSVDNSAKYTDGGDVDPIGVVYDADVPDGEYMWVVVSGIADVYYSGNDVVRATFSRVPTSGEALPDGHAINEPLPSPPFATDKHFQEIGHSLESISAPGLAKTILHFN